MSAREKYFLEGNTFQNHHGGMVLIGDYLYAGKGQRLGIPICIEFATGRVVWGGNIRNAGEGSAAVLAADGRLYFHYENGLMLLIDATPQGYKESGSFRIPNFNPAHASWSHPVIAAGRLYVREQDQLHVYDVRRESTILNLRMLNLRCLNLRSPDLTDSEFVDSEFGDSR